MPDAPAPVRPLIVKAPRRPRLPRPWVWDDKIPFCLRACDNHSGYVELGPSGRLQARNAPKKVIDAIYARLEEAEVR